MNDIITVALVDDHRVVTTSLKTFLESHADMLSCRRGSRRVMWHDGYVHLKAATRAPHHRIGADSAHSG